VPRSCSSVVVFLRFSSGSHSVWILLCVHCSASAECLVVPSLEESKSEPRSLLDQLACPASSLHLALEIFLARAATSAQESRLSLQVSIFCRVFVCGSLQGDAGIVLQSPDQKTRGFVVQIPLPR
jgi:hypothetical protein